MVEKAGGHGEEGAYEEVLLLLPGNYAFHRLLPVSLDHVSLGYWYKHLRRSSPGSEPFDSYSCLFIAPMFVPG